MNLIRLWLKEHIPKWAEFAICSNGKYLGFVIGPTASTAQWCGAIDKYKSRVKEINSAGITAKFAISRYNQTAVPVFSYLAQLCPPPRNLIHEDKG